MAHLSDHVGSYPQCSVGSFNFEILVLKIVRSREMLPSNLKRLLLDFFDDANAVRISEVIHSAHTAANPVAAELLGLGKCGSWSASVKRAHSDSPS
jgi:hypothetical protein